MTIRIISECQNQCLHCMQESGPSRNEVMSFDTFKKSLDLFSDTISTSINISGGEPTLHPYILYFLDEACKLNKIVYLLSNGLFLRDNPLLRDNIFLMMSKYKNLKLQITSIKGLYNNFIHEDDINPMLNNMPIYRTIKHNILFIHELTFGVIPIGRAKDSITQIEKFSFIANNRQVPKCFNPYNIIATMRKPKLDIIFIINHLKLNSKTSFCFPLIKENGDVVFGEYESCNFVWNVHNSNQDIEYEKILGPCGSCYSNQTQIDYADKHLSVFVNRHNKLNESLYFKTM